MFSKFKKRGETLVEVITAITVIAIAGTASVSVIISTFRTTAISQEYLVAQNLAREAMESVINKRDTNWLKYPSNKGECWLRITDPEPAAAENCLTEDADEIFAKDNYYYILRDFEDGDGELSISKTINGIDLLNEEGLEIGLNLDTDENLYVSADPDEAKWFREVYIDEVDEDTPLSEKVKVNVKVQWRGVHKLGTYEASTILTNYAN